MCTCLKINPLRTILERNVDREGPSADCIANYIFRFILHWKLHRRGETKLESVRKLNERLKEVLENYQLSILYLLETMGIDNQTL